MTGVRRYGRDGINGEDGEDEEDEEDEDGETVYTRDEVLRIIHGVVRDVQSGYTDLLPEDYV